MDVITIQTEIRNEALYVVNLLGKIQTELDGLVNLTKEDGPLDRRVVEGLESSKTVLQTTGCSLQNEDTDVTELHTNIVNSTVKDSQVDTLVTSQEINDTSE